MAHVAGVDRALDHQQIWMSLCRNATSDWMRAVHRKRYRPLYCRHIAFGVCQNEPRHPICEGRLADSGRSCEQPAMRQAAATVALEQRTLRSSMTVEYRCLARRQRIGMLVTLGAFTHEAVGALRTGAPAGERRSLTSLQMRSATWGLGSVASMSKQRAGSQAASR